MNATQPEVAVRPATPGDRDALLELWSVAAENDARPVDTPEAVARLLQRDPGACLVAESEARLVGSVIAGWDGWRAHLYRLAVHPDHRRRGIARRLLDAAEERLVDLGATRADAMVLSTNALGRQLWSGLGYAEQDEWRRWVKPLGDARD